MLSVLLLACGLTVAFGANQVHADPGCQNNGVYLLFARGSGAGFDSNEALSFKTIVQDKLGATPNTWAELGNIDGDRRVDPTHEYRAIPVDNWNAPAGYGPSVDVGANEVVAHLNDRAVRCPTETFVLAGYSQGADVIGWALERTGGGPNWSLTPQAFAHIGFVALYADPKNRGNSGQGQNCSTGSWVRGNVPCDNAPVAGVLGARTAYIPTVLEGKVGSWCDKEDGICTGDWGWIPGTHAAGVYHGHWIWVSALEVAHQAWLKTMELNRPVAAPSPAPAPSYPTEVGSPKLAATRNQDGRLALFYVGTDYNIYYQYQLNPGGWWGPEHRIDAHAKGVAVTTSADGRIEIFYIGGDNSVVHKYQTSPNSHSWSAEEYFGTSVRGIAAARNSAGQVAVATVDWNHQIHIRKQNSPNSWGGTNWQHLPAVALDIGMTTSADGRNEMFYVGGNGSLIHRWEMWVGGNWSGEEGHSARICKVATARNDDGRLEVFAIGDNNHLYNKWQWQPNYPWFDSWGGLNGVATQLASAVNADGRIELFYVIGDNTIWHQWQNNPGAGQGWSAQSQMYGRVSA